jgi:hypothetical protein
VLEEPVETLAGLAAFGGAEVVMEASAPLQVYVPLLVVVVRDTATTATI